MIEPTYLDYVRCAESRDYDYRFVRNRSCRGRIEVDRDHDDGDRLYCPDCGRTVYPRGKRRHGAVQVRAVPEGVVAFLEDLVAKVSPDWKHLSHGVWRADTPQGEAKLVVVDYCDREYTARDWIAANRACCVVVDAAACKHRFLPEPWLAWTRLADVVCRPGALGELLSKAAGAAPTSQVAASMPVYSASIQPVIPGEATAGAPAARKRHPKPAKQWPDPQTHTVAKCWTRRTDSAFCISTKTQSRYDGQAGFGLHNGKPTLQAQLVRLLCFRHPKAMSLYDILQQIYPAELEAAATPPAAQSLLKKLRALVSAVRSKLERADINPDILPPLNVETPASATLALRLAHIHKLDDSELDRGDLSPDADPRPHLRRHSES
ncbi:MAG: hypothetical protein R6V58_13205 [Planctomycetota bacterium]